MPLAASPLTYRRDAEQPSGTGSVPPGFDKPFDILDWLPRELLNILN
jgi:hypothetical protein